MLNVRHAATGHVVHPREPAARSRQSDVIKLSGDQPLEPTGQSVTSSNCLVTSSWSVQVSL